MARSNLSALGCLLPVLLLAGASVACGESETTTSGGASYYPPGSSTSAPKPAPAPDQNAGTPASSGAAQRAIAEADVVQLAAGRLYALSRSGTLSIVDVSKPGQLALLGQAYLPGEPFELYLRGDQLVVMTNGAYSISGSENAVANGNAGSGASAPTQRADVTTGAGVIVIDAKDPGLMQRVATFPVAGQIADSRLVGEILYLATYESSTCYRCGASPRTLVTSFDLTTPATMKQVEQVTFLTGSIPSFGEAAWKRSIIVGNGRMYLGGAGLGKSTTADEGVIDVLDVSDKTGKLAKGAHVTTTGPVTSRWQMSEKDDTLRVVSQRGVGYVPNGSGQPDVQTFTVWNTRSLQAAGKTSLRLPRQESLKSVRFDGDRAYAITFAETDPLFVIDLANPLAPKQRGELTMNGYVFHMEPRGDRLLGLGVDRTDPKGSLNVSLFDVADMDHPKMLQRVAFGPTTGGTNDALAQTALAEDQDRIQKAFRVFEDGLVTVPFSTQASSTCALGGAGGIQLIDWQQDALVKQATLTVPGNPRRALVNGGELLAVSDSNVSAFDLTKRSVQLRTADLVIGSCEARPAAVPAPIQTPVQMPDDSYYGEQGHGQGYAYDEGPQSEGFFCTTGRIGGSAGTRWATVLVGLAVAFGAARRRARSL